MVGTARYLSRVWNAMRRYVEAGSPVGNPSAETTRRAHKTIQTVTDHIERLRFNTALATLMDQLNYLTKLAPAEIGRFAFETYVVMLAPMAPHIAEELWRALGHTTSVHLEPWPKFDPRISRATRWSRWWCRSTARCATASQVAAGDARRGSARAGAQERGRHAPSRRQAAQEDHLRPRQARQHRRLIFFNHSRLGRIVIKYVQGQNLRWCA